MFVMHVLDHSAPLHSGYSFRTLSILREQRVLGWRTSQVTSAKQGPSPLVEESHGFRFYRTPANRRLQDRIPVLNQWSVVSGLKRRLRGLVRPEPPDILHAHSPCLTALAAIPVGRELGIPVVYEMRATWEDAAVTHGTTREGSLRYRLSRALETHVLHQADAVTTICEGLRDEIVKRGVPADKVTVIPNAVDIGQFPFVPEPGPRPAGVVDADLRDRRVLGFIGSFYGYEGLHVLLEAMPMIVAREPAAHLLLVGGGPEEERLRAIVEQRRLGGCVTFTGRVPHDQVSVYYSLIDVFVYPRLSTRLTSITTPLKPLEAMACGRLVTASDIGGHREIIQGGVTGWLFPAGDAAALARVVGDVIAEPAGWPARRLAARRFVEQERTWRASVARYKQVYHSLREP